jgi:hypothetical protein
VIALLLFLAVEAQPVPDAGVAADRATTMADAGGSAPVEDTAAQGVTGPVLPDSAARDGLPMGKLRGRVLAKGTRAFVFAAAITVDQNPAGETDVDGQFEAIVPCGRRRVIIQAPAFETAEVARDACADPAPIIVRLAPLENAPIYETVVTAQPSQPALTLTGQELTKTPGSLGDPFRTIESLPGVASPVWPLPIYAVRGANPGNTGFMLDDLRVPALFHLALGPSVIHPYFFDELSFYPGGYPARYGRYVAGLVSAQTRQPASDMVHASVDVRLYDAGGLLSAPLPGGNGAVVAAARYSYTGPLVSLISPGLSLNYWDYQVRADRNFGALHLTLLALGSQDTMSSTGGAPPYGDFLMVFHRVSLRAHLPVGNGQVIAQVAVGYDHSKAPIINLSQASMAAQAFSVMPRLSYRRPTEWVDWEVGFDSELQWLAPTSSVEQVGDSDLGQKRTAQLLAGYASATIRAGSRLLLTPEVRLDSYAGSGVEKSDVGPRLGVRLLVEPLTWIEARGGRFSQAPSLPLQIPAAENFGLALYGLQTSWQASLGAGTKRLRGVEIELTGYVQRYVLTDLRDPTVFWPDLLASDFLVRRDARSYGAELLIRRPASERLHGWLAYTISQNQRALGGGVIGPSDWDQRHILNLVLGYRLGRNTFGGRAHLNTGRPVLIRNSDAETFVRLPTYYQIDLRAERRLLFNKFVLDVYLEMVNCTFNRQIFDMGQNIPSGPIVVDSQRIVLPSLGVHGEF